MRVVSVFSSSTLCQKVHFPNCQIINGHTSLTSQFFHNCSFHLFFVSKHPYLTILWDYIQSFVTALHKSLISKYFISTPTRMADPHNTPLTEPLNPLIIFSPSFIVHALTCFKLRKDSKNGATTQPFSNFNIGENLGSPPPGLLHSGLILATTLPNR